MKLRKLIRNSKQVKSRTRKTKIKIMNKKNNLQSICAACSRGTQEAEVDTEAEAEAGAGATTDVSLTPWPT